MDLLLLTAILDGQASSGCSFTVSLDGGPALPADTSIPGPASVQLPDGVQRVSIQATPASPNHWPVAGDFQLQSSGNLVPLSAPPEFEPPRGVTTSGTGLDLITVHLSRVRDATSEALASLGAVPAIRTGMIPSAWPPAAGGQPAGNWPPTDWDTPEQDDLNYIDSPAVTGSDLNIQQQSIDPSTTDLVLQLKNVSAPQTLAVSWPDAVSRAEAADPTPFLVYFHPNVGQNAPEFYTNPQVGTYPFGFDFVFFGLWRYMNYTGDPLVADPFAKGLPYQMAASSRSAVIVLPCNAVGPEVGVLLSADSMQTVLREIQAFMFRQSGVYVTPGLGRTALAAFSAGNGLVESFLARPDNRAHPFYLDTLQELYMFEGGDSWLSQAITWAGVGTNATKMIRAYTQSALPSYANLLGTASPASSPFVATSADGLRTAAVLPSTAWNRAAAAAGNAAIAAGAQTFQDTHQLISAMMLKDALSVSGF
jgi:hypothetical protein